MALSDGRKQLAQVEVDFLHWFIGHLYPESGMNKKRRLFVRAGDWSRMKAPKMQVHSIDYFGVDRFPVHKVGRWKSICLSLRTYLLPYP